MSEDPHYKRAMQLINAEESLNAIMFRSMPIGGLFGEFFSQVYLNIPMISRWQNILFPLQIIFKSLINKFSSRGKSTTNIQIIITKLNNKEHINRLVAPSVIYFNNTALLISYTKED